MATKKEILRGNKRLLKLACHLITGKLGHKKFDYRNFNYIYNGIDSKGCGTKGCAIG